MTENTKKDVLNKLHLIIDQINLDNVDEQKLLQLEDMIDRIINPNSESIREEDQVILGYLCLGWYIDEYVKRLSATVESVNKRTSSQGDKTN